MRSIISIMALPDFPLPLCFCLALAASWIFSMISVWEVAKRVEKGQLVFDRPVPEFIDQALHQPGLEVAEITRPVLLESCSLPGSFHGDPADQIIVATVRLRGAQLITADQRIQDYAHVRSVW